MKCLTCLFNTLCTEKKQCPIIQVSRINSPDLEEELRQFAKIKYLKTEEQSRNKFEAFQEARERFERKSRSY